VLWITAGLGCDGESIPLTGATQPSIEDLVLRGIPWTPAITLYHPLFAHENGDDFLAPFHRAAEGRLDEPFILVVEGSIPDETNKAEGYWASLGTDPATGQPITTCTWIDRLAALGFSQREWLEDPIRWYQQIHPDDKARWGRRSRFPSPERVT
jgi:hydrogenase small subunit